MFDINYIDSGNILLMYYALKALRHTHIYIYICGDSDVRLIYIVVYHVYMRTSIFKPAVFLMIHFKIKSQLLCYWWFTESVKTKGKWL